MIPTLTQSKKLSDRSAKIILVLATFLIFSNTLFNGFVGDDEVVLLKNDFYRSWSNFHFLFSDKYIGNSERYFENAGRYFDSGDVSYRPVRSVTYFFDFWLWKEKPFGYHLTNVFLHVLNVILVYFVLKGFTKDIYISFLSALLFSCHPLKVEPVNAISYRQDLLPCLFVLSAFYFFMQYLRAREKRWPFVLSVIFYFLAVFSKESVIVFPVVLFLYEWMFYSESQGLSLARVLKRYSPFVLVGVFYIFIYIYVFPNSALSDNTLFGNKVSLHILYICKIFAEYLYFLVFPFSVRVLPPLYLPALTQPIAFEIFKSLLMILAFLVTVIAFRKNKIVLFCGMWFLIFYLPVSNVIPLDNPMAYRFMYLPSVGFFAGLMAILNLRPPDIFQKAAKQLQFLAKVVLIGSSITVTFVSNFSWENNIVLASGWIEDYPKDPKGYSILGIEYFKIGYCGKAKEMMLQNISLGTKDARSFYIVGYCSSDKPKEAVGYFEQALILNPNYIPAQKALKALTQNNK